MVNKNKLELEILEVYELNGRLIVKWKCKYGEGRFGLGLRQKYINPETGRPRYEEETEDLIKKKFSQKHGKAIRKDIFKENWGKKLIIKFDE